MNAVTQALQPFLWGQGGQKLSPEEVAHKRAIATALSRGEAPQNVGQGLNRIGEALYAMSLNNRADTAETEGRAAASEAFNSMMAGQPTTQSIVSQLDSPWTTDGQRAVLGALLEQNMAPAPEPEYEYKDGRWFELGNGAPQVVSEHAPMDRAPLVNVNTGDTAPEIGTIPQGYEVVLDENGQRFMRPIPGGPAAIEADEAAAQQEARETQTNRYGEPLLQDLDRAMAEIEANPSGTTGILGAITRGLPWSSSLTVAEFLKTAEGTAAFDRLQSMRDASPTGGALGAVTERELELLKSAIGSLSQNQRPDVLLDNIKRVKNIYLDIIHGEGQGPQREQLSFQNQNSGLPQAGDVVDGYVFKGGDPADQNNWSAQ